MIVKMIQDLGKRMEAKIENMQEMFNRDLEELKNKHLCFLLEEWLQQQCFRPDSAIL